MKLSSSIRLEGSYHIVDGYFPQGLRFSHVFCTYCQGPIYFFVIVADNKRCFLTYLQMWLPESDVRRIIRKMLSFHGKTEKNCCLVDTAFSTGCDEKSFVSIFGESAAAASTRRRRCCGAVHRGCFFREEGWLTAPCIAHHHTRTVRRWYTVSWFTKNGTIIFLTSGRPAKF